ncbi:MAG: hypothetical protein EBS23_07590 [Betaproteobacteria bacterium]|nr:hypothetical protein [Betaproteobacteria bacterium]
MIDIDLADPLAQAGPPPHYLLGPAALLLVLLPLAVCAGLHHATATAQATAREVEQRIDHLKARASAQRELQRQAAAQRAGAAELAALRAQNRALLDLLPALTSGLQPDMRVAALAVDVAGGRITGSASSAAEVSRWLARSASANAGLDWGAPEIRHAAGDLSRVEFELEAHRIVPEQGGGGGR